VLPRYGKGESIRWFETSAFYMYHAINAWEEDGKIVLVGCRIEHPLADDPQNPATSKPVPTIGFLRLAPYLWKWTLDLTTGAVKEEQLDDVFVEFPRTDNRRLGRPTRYSYNPRLARIGTINFDGLIKHDMQTGRTTSYSCPPGLYCGETTFAPRAGAAATAAEDDGYIVSFVCDQAGEQAQLFILDAQNVEAGPVGRVQIPGRVPVGYHTWWVSAEDLAQQQPVSPAS
jgi:carotenoid cleavage dioxygenase